MPAALDHTIVPSSDKNRSARFLTDILGLPAPTPSGHFVSVEVANGVTLDYDDAFDFRSQHYAFRVDEDEFDPIFDRVKAAGVEFYADPGHRLAGEINHRRGGRGFYFSDPDGHNLEVFTVPD